MASKAFLREARPPPLCAIIVLKQITRNVSMLTESFPLEDFNRSHRSETFSSTTATPTALEGRLTCVRIFDGIQFTLVYS